ncbi:hypothetical protein ACFQ14_01845 [Pseudahrensia aquimaris]|uniref:HTH araC/xylS-type domain-containing protein n=1 Tax=Pseudahrensia aquimaris TaxID=744461 RepID=A0ABW3FDZ1_9HYPH
MRYDPKGNSIDRAVDGVRFEEIEPPARLKSIVHRFLELKTEGLLKDDYRFHALPDACTYAIFDQQKPVVAGITRLRASFQELNLGRSFHFINVRFLPGVWQSERSPVELGSIEEPYAGDLPLVAFNERLVGQSLESSVPVLVELVEMLRAWELVVENPVTEKIFSHVDDIFSVTDMAEVADLSPRQLQRVLKRTTGFSPHDFLKILRLQQSLRGEPSLAYADQSHFIHSFKKATGYTPGRYARKFDV